MGTVNDKLNKILSTKTEIKNAIIEKGVDVSDLDTFASYADKIRSISGGGGSCNTFQPNSDMLWGKGICESDIQEGFTHKVLHMIDDTSLQTDIVVPSNGAVKTSDGGYYTSDTQHIWNDTSARVSENYNGRKLRWLIYYYPAKRQADVFMLPETIYAVFNSVDFNETTFNDKAYSLEYFDIINNSVAYSISKWTYFFRYCYNLIAIPAIAIGVKGENIALLFEYCYNLKYFDNNFSLANETIGGGIYKNSGITKINQNMIVNYGGSCNTTFQNCINLKEINNIDISLRTQATDLFNGCTSLTVIKGLNITKANTATSLCRNCTSLREVSFAGWQPIACNYAFENCKNLRIIKGIDGSQYATTGNNNVFDGCTSLEWLDITNLNGGINISDSTKFTREALVHILNNLKDKTGLSPQTLTIGATNIQKLTTEDKAIATNKNWRIA